jgi:hypothetical protein
MIIIWHGQSFFELVTKDKEGKEIKIVLDPFDEGLGLKVPKTEARILIISRQRSDHNNEKAISGEPFLGDEPSIHLHSSTLKGFVIEEPGEYEINDVYVQGIPAGEVIIYLIETEGIKICHLGDFGQKELTPEQLDQLGDIDILMVPIGGVGTIDAKGASKIISQIEPKLVIPMHYQIPKLKLKLNSLEQFLKEMGSPVIEVQKKLKVKSLDLSKEKMQIVVLEP